MSQPRDASSDVAADDLRAALAPAGAPGLRLERWALVGSVGMLAIAAGALIWRIVAPLPAPARTLAPSVPPIIAAAPGAALPGAAASVEARRALLDALTGAGNVFAPDRRPWPEPAPAAREGGQGAAAITLGAEPAEPPPVRDDRGGLDLSAIKLTPVSNQLPPALFKEASAMRLEVLFGAVASSVEQPSLGAAIRRGEAHGVYHEGDEIPGESDAWRLLAIDLDNERVILTRQGYNVELRLRSRGEAAVVAAAPGSADSARTDAGGDARSAPTVSRAAPEAVRAALQAAGLEDWEIEAVLRLAQRPEARDAAKPVAQAPASSEGPGDGETASPAAKPPVVPGDIAALIRMMATGQAPTAAPKPAPQQPKQEKPGGGS